jgi:class 3 adenylate cyclase/streptogramin lyase
MPRSDERLLTVSERRLLTVLFTDIVGSTEVAVEMGDARWRELVSRHHRLVRQELKRFGGKEIDTAGDGFFATFDRPARAIRCAAASAASVRSLGVEIRAGLHLGEVELAGKKVGGVAVHTGARVLGAAAPGEVLVTGTLRELVSGAGLDFADRGSHRLRGIPGEWHLFALVAVDGTQLEPPLAADAAAERRRSILAPTLLRRSRLPALTAVGLVGSIVALVLVLGGPSEPSRTQTAAEPPRNSIVAVDPVARRIIHVTPNALQSHGGGNPKLAVGEGGVWVRSRNLVHVDPATGEVVGNPLEPLEIAVIDPLADRGVEVGFRTVWIGGLRERSGVALLRWNPATDEELPATVVPIDSPLTDVALGHGSIWLTFVDGSLVRLRGETRRVEATIQVGGSLDGVVVGTQGVWVLNIAAGTVTRVDPRTDVVMEPVDVPGSILAMAAAEDRVWLLDAVGEDVFSVDADGDLGDPIPIGPDPSGIAVGLDAVWVSDEGGRLFRIDPRTHEVTSVHVGGDLTAIAVDEQHEALWLTVGGD